MKHFKLITLAGLSILLLGACKKEKFFKQEKAEEEIASPKVLTAIWGCGSDQRVYRWNGATWDEPHPATRLFKVSSSKQDGTVWGIGASDKVYRWNGTSWDYPNPAMNLLAVASLNVSEAWGVGNYNNIYRTTNGGLGWSLIPKTGLPTVSGVQGLIDISVGDNSADVAGVATDGKVYKYNSTTSSWSMIYPTAAVAGMVSVSLRASNIYWALGKSTATGPYDKPFVWNNVTGLTLMTPTASFRSLSCNYEGETWAIGTNNKVYKSDGSIGWFEPNPAAGLAYISVGRY